ncbi:hypothetical protein HHK36_031555 [Tetracentron sinense]|uniref:Leucine-rich repeat-containing N-terminal plant-type domain-containing protein n=1 Tax=Tetracentron sinense TaxID=13715 RepID=A0A834YAA1_TETSI|nr:hypothetical protein HHK36_031555 [Tetracentron sinense]
MLKLKSSCPDSALGYEMNLVVEEPSRWHLVSYFEPMFEVFSVQISNFCGDIYGTITVDGGPDEPTYMELYAKDGFAILEDDANYPEEGQEDGYVTVRLKHMVPTDAVEATVDVTLISSSGDGEDSATHVYGKITARNSNFSDESVLFQKALNEHIDVKSGQLIPLSRSMVVVPFHSCLIVQEDLLDYDAGFSSSDVIAKASVPFRARISGTFEKPIYGHRWGILVKIIMVLDGCRNLFSLLCFAFETYRINGLALPFLFYDRGFWMIFRVSLLLMVYREMGEEEAKGGPVIPDLMLEPVIIELERQRAPVVISHQAVLRALNAYFADRPLKEIPHIESSLLLQLKQNLSFNTNSTSLKLLSWNSSTDCCYWKGVTCDGTRARVTGLDLSSESITGGIDNSSSLFDLCYLQRLNLAGNRSLQTLVLGDTNFAGKLPDSIGNLKKLSRLELARGRFNGSIPSSMGNLTLLVFLDFSYNNFSGLIPSLRMSENLSQLFLAHNRLAGSTTSTHWDSLVNLKNLDLQDNSLTGRIPSSLFALLSLQKLLLANNQLTGGLGEFINASSSLLDTLDLSSNKLEGQIPKAIFELPDLKICTLSSNNFNGTLQLIIIQNLRNLSSLDLSYNSLSIDTAASNSVPSSFPQIGTPKLASCNLTVFPEFLRNQSKLSWLDLSDNLEQPLPDLSSITVTIKGLELELVKILTIFASIDFLNNNFQGHIPEVMGDLKLQYALNLSRNDLSGHIPPYLGNVKQLESLDLFSNKAE